jgi:hypothetical protein
MLPRGSVLEKIGRRWQNLASKNGKESPNKVKYGKTGKGMPKWKNI